MTTAYQLVNRAFCVLCIRMLHHFLCTTHNEDDHDHISPIFQSKPMLNHVHITAFQNTFRDLHSSHETLNGREVFCRLRLPVPSSPSASEPSSSLQASSSLRSAAFPGESSLLGVRLVLVDMMVGRAGQKEPRRREPRGFIAFARPLQPRTHAPSRPKLAATGRQTSRERHS